MPQLDHKFWADEFDQKITKYFGDSVILVRPQTTAFDVDTQSSCPSPPISYVVTGKVCGGSGRSLNPDKDERGEVEIVLSKGDLESQGVEPEPGWVVLFKGGSYRIDSIGPCTTGNESVFWKGSGVGPFQQNVVGAT